MPSVGCLLAVPTADGRLIPVPATTPLSRGVVNIPFAPKGVFVGELEADAPFEEWQKHLFCRTYIDPSFDDIDPYASLQDTLPVRVWYDARSAQFIIITHDILLNCGEFFEAVHRIFNLPPDRCSVRIDPTCVRRELAWRGLSRLTHDFVYDPARGQAVIRKRARPLGVRTKRPRPLLRRSPPDQVAGSVPALVLPVDAPPARYILREPHHQVAERWLYHRLRGGVHHYLDRTFAQSALAAAPGLARTTLTALETAGLVEEINAETGTFVLKTFVPFYELQYLFEAADQVGAYDIFVHTAAFEVRLAGLAAEHRDDATLDHLRHAASWRPPSPSEADFTTAFASFTAALASSTHRPEPIDANYRTMAPRASDLWHILNHAVGDPLTGIVAAVEQHRTAIVDAVERRDPAGARAAMRTHLTRVRDFLFIPVPLS
ncbi:FCD domain-containing protein [Methylobacterium sp. J-030]|uniref:FadR/GntR family transcriptional regulator n=1 Tax=Methylobacterium sp. J-030 TaxID=2836627 RepID=UPI001FBBB9BD|nr:FCD domain-containing protein [Methylobacterium sp. J-030]MCJ2073378.1 FCD domain-containing protein [Methylobacterium sp. J-030]